LEEEVSTKDELEFLINGKPEEHDLKIILSNHMLIDMDNVVITPHTAFFSKEAMARILDTTVLSINSFIAGSPQNEVKRK